MTEPNVRMVDLVFNLWLRFAGSLHAGIRSRFRPDTRASSAFRNRAPASQEAENSGGKGRRFTARIAQLPETCMAGLSKHFTPANYVEMWRKTLRQSCRLSISKKITLGL
jgi:hypothetical protein